MYNIIIKGTVCSIELFKGPNIQQECNNMLVYYNQKRLFVSVHSD